LGDSLSAAVGFFLARKKLLLFVQNSKKNIKMENQYGMYLFVQVE